MASASTTLGSIPRDWSGFQVRFRYHSSRYEITVENPRGAARGVSHLELDGTTLSDLTRVVLTDDGGAHQVRVVLG